MKMIVAYIRPYMAEKVVKTLQAMPEVPGASLTEIKGFGRGRGLREAHALAAKHEQFGTLQKIRLETMVPDAAEDAVVKAIREAALTGDYGDGKIYVVTLDRAVRIRTGEEGDAAN